MVYSRRTSPLSLLLDPLYHRMVRRHYGMVRGCAFITLPYMPSSLLLACRALLRGN